MQVDESSSLLNLEVFQVSDQLLYAFLGVYPL